MAQSIGSTGNSHKQGGAGDQAKNQPEAQNGQKMADQSGGKTQGKGNSSAGGGPRSTH